MMLEVQKHMCATCIYRKDCQLDLKTLEAAAADPKMKGHFKGFRVCHNSKTACCRGFWNKHKNHFDIGQLAQRMKAMGLDVIAYVEHTSRSAVARDMKRLSGKGNK
jgi:hypothetical protein